MKIAYLVEDQSDFAVINVLVRRILNEEPEAIYRERRPGGVTGVRGNLVAVAWEAWHSETNGVVVVVDNDGALPLHEPAHLAAQKTQADKGCNYCQLVTSLPELPGGPPLPPLRFAIGVAVQALEAWLLFGADRKQEREPEKLDRRVLKQKLYGAQRLPRPQRLAVGKPIAENVKLDELSQACPSFSYFAESVRQLRS
ncbi:MAG: hypothetical protein NTW87_27195 [Planctomycetota bacterium]|nr:hypothetical protein [Planctomycetota bacterium]